MKRLSLAILLIILTLNAFCQINMNDSTFQAIGYWNKGEKQSYIITNDNYKVESADTTDREFWKYKVDISIVDSTKDSYTIDWYYHDYNAPTESELLKKLLQISKDITIRIKTNELGVFQEIDNWQDIKKNIFRGLSIIKEEFKNVPQMDKVIEQYEATYSTKESIEAAAIREIQQFYSYHGGKYKLGEEITSNLKLPNLYDSKNPFDTEIILSLDEIHSEDNNVIIRMKQIVNSVQLTKTTFDYLAKTSETLGTQPPKWDEFPPLKNETWVSSRIHGSGWIIYSLETREVSAEGVTKVQNRTIEIE